MTDNRTSSAHRRTATLIGFVAILLWSALALLTAASGAIPPFELAALTFLIGGALGLGYAAARGRLGALLQPWPVWLVGVGGLFGYHALYFAALRLAPPAEASLVAYLWPLLIVLMSAALPGERLSARHVVGALIGFAGAGVLFWGKRGAAGAALSADAALGYCLALGCAFVWSSYSVLSRFLRKAPTEAVAGFCLVDLRARGALSRRLRDDGAAGGLEANGAPSSASGSGRSGLRSMSGITASRTATSVCSASPPMRRPCCRP